jgi:hypothetical protein
MSPLEIDSISNGQNESYISNLAKHEKELIKANKSKKDSIIGAITSNFSEIIVTNDDIIDSLSDYSRLQLIEMLIDMIVNKY